MNYQYKIRCGETTVTVDAPTRQTALDHAFASEAQVLVEIAFRDHQNINGHGLVVAICVTDDDDGAFDPAPATERVNTLINEQWQRDGKWAAQVRKLEERIEKLSHGAMLTQKQYDEAKAEVARLTECDKLASKLLAEEKFASAALRKHKRHTDHLLLRLRNETGEEAKQAALAIFDAALVGSLVEPTIACFNGVWTVKDDDNDAQDAARYRWLRKRHWYDSALCVVTNPKENIRLGGLCPSDGQLDQTIDAALKTVKQ